MSEEPNPSFKKARDEALRALITHGGLNPEQVSALKLSQVHLATGTLVVDPDEFDPSSEPDEKPFDLQLDERMQRALIAWLVMRPDGPNDHLFPGTGLSGLDVDTITQAIEAKESAEPQEADDSIDTKPPARVESREPIKTPPEPPRRRPDQVKATVDTSAPSPAERPEEPQGMSLSEVNALRKRLAESYDAWAPIASPTPSRPSTEPVPKDRVPGPPPEPSAKPTPRKESPPPASQVEPSPGVMDMGAPPEPGIQQWEEEEEGPRQASATPPPESLPRLSDRLRWIWKSSEDTVTLNLSYRIAFIGGIGLLLAACCIGLVAAGSTMFGTGGLAGLLAGTTPSATAVPTIAISTLTPTASPTSSATASPTASPGATFTVPLEATDTPAVPPTAGPTPTPIIVVVTATPTPEPATTATLVPTDTPVGGEISPGPTATSTPQLKYPAPVLLEPEDGGTVPGMINYLKWEPVGPLADDEWYAVRLVFLQQGESVYQGDQIKASEWRVPDRFYYQADGPALEYRWYVFVERQNPDGSTTPLSPESETFVFRWE